MATINEYMKQTQYPTYNAPEAPTYDTYNAPARDEGRIRKLTQLAAAPGLRTLRNAYNRSMAGNEENQNVVRMKARAALEGLGSGIESTLAGAKSAALNEYNQEYNALTDQAKANWTQGNYAKTLGYQGALAAAQANFAGAQDVYKYGYQSYENELDRDLKRELADKDEEEMYNPYTDPFAKTPGGTTLVVAPSYKDYSGYYQQRR